MADARIALDYDDSVLLRRFVRTEKQMVFGVVNAINRAAKRLRAAEYEQLQQGGHFIFRKKDYFFGKFKGSLSDPLDTSQKGAGGVAARIDPFARVPSSKLPPGRLYAEISVSQGSLAGQRRLLFAGFETGEQRRPFTPGAADVAVPISGRPARPSRSGAVPPRFTFAGLKFKGFRRGRLLKRRRGGGKQFAEGVFGEFGKLQHARLQQRGVQWKGLERTFILLSSRGLPDGGVFQRFGPERGDIRVIWKFVRPFNLERNLHWLETANRLAPVYLHEEMENSTSDVIIHNAGKAA